MFILTYKGKHIPSPPSGRGGTWVELTEVDPPRLFRTQHHANLAARHWEEGPLMVTYTDEGDVIWERRPCDRPELSIEEVEIVPRRTLLSLFQSPTALDKWLRGRHAS